jgi:hypothetical protein
MIVSSLFDTLDRIGLIFAQRKTVCQEKVSARG